MLNFTGKIVDIKRKLFQLDPDKEYDVEIKVHREKRSLNANSYAWVLISQIAEVLGASKEEIYFQELKKYGQSLLIPVPKGEKPNGYFKYYEYKCTSLLNGKEADWYITYKGSSDFDTKEMSILINGIVEDCKELEIPTKEDLEIQRIIEDWEKEND